MFEQLIAFLEEIRNNKGSFFIEAEAKLTRMNSFINGYNAENHIPININSEGIIILQDDANKYGLELRLYVPVEPPRALVHLFTRTRGYRGEYPYRLNDNNIILDLFENGCAIGENH